MKREILTSMTLEELEAVIINAFKKVTTDNHQQHDTDEEFLTQREAVKFLHISLPTIIRWKREGKIPYYQEGRTALFKKSELLKTLAKNESLLR